MPKSKSKRSNYKPPKVCTLPPPPPGLTKQMVRKFFSMKSDDIRRAMGGK